MTAGVFAIAAAGLLAAAPATADPLPPDCTAADMAGIASGVAAATSAYLFTHPDVNDFFTNLHGQPREDMPTLVGNFFDANPVAHTDLLGIRQPLTDFRARCGLTQPEDTILGE